MASDGVLEIDGLARFNEIIGVHSSIELFMKCHLILENFMEGLIGTLVSNPEAWSVSRVTFAQKVSMCHAFGLLPKDDAQSLRAVNKVRNKMAHDLTFTISRGELESLVADLSARTRDHYRRLADDDKVMQAVLHQLPLVFLPLIMSVGHHLQMKRYESENRDKIQQLNGAPLRVRVG